MKRIFLDTNFLMDYLVRADYSLVASKILEEGSKRGYKFEISFLTVANFAYINRKMPAAMLRHLLAGILEAFEIADNTSKHLLNAIYMDSPDYEDAVQYQTALSSRCQGIVTRNGKDFPFSKLDIYTPDEFLELLN